MSYISEWKVYSLSRCSRWYDKALHLYNNIIWRITLKKKNYWIPLGLDTHSDFSIVSFDLPPVTGDKSYRASPQMTCDFRQFLSLVVGFQTCWTVGKFPPLDFSQYLCITMLATSDQQLCSGKHRENISFLHTHTKNLYSPATLNESLFTIFLKKSRSVCYIPSSSD